MCAELAIVRQISKDESEGGSGRVIYLAPTKSLCHERALDWNIKFGELGTIVSMHVKFNFMVRFDHLRTYK